MTILWCGAEDSDLTGTLVNIGNSSDSFRRCVISSSYLAHSISFTPQTSLWIAYNTTDYMYNNNHKYVGVRNSTSGSWVGGGSSSAGSLAVYKGNNAGSTQLATSSYITEHIDRVDLHIESYGAAGRIRGYSNGYLTVDYGGDLVTGDGGSLDQVVLLESGFYTIAVAGIIVSTEDTRLLYIKTMVPDATGDTTSWSGTYADINEMTLNNTTAIYTDTADAEFQCNVTGMPSGVYSVKAVAVAYQIAQGSPGLEIQHGIRSGTTTYLEAAQAVDTYWEPKIKIYETNPITSNPFSPAEVNAIQMAFKAVAA
jgi:hypothetical protein